MVMHGCRDLGIGGEAHKKIDAAVLKGGFEIVSGPFELGTLHSHLNLISCYGHVLPTHLLASRQALKASVQ